MGAGAAAVAIALMDSYGGSKITNVIFENTDGLKAGKTNTHQRFIFTGSTGGTYTNTTLIGMPTYGLAKHSTYTDSNKVWVLSITISEEKAKR